MIVLGIETSCDDTSVAVLQGEPGLNSGPKKLLSLQSFSSEEVLRPFGGVVPEIAAREHMLKIVPTIRGALSMAQKKLEDVDLIAVTNRPGLAGALLTGLHAAKTLSLILKCPITPVNHLLAHLEVIHLEKSISYPYIGILVSGGNSAFYLVKDFDRWELLGNTVDDAAGEAFDKGGKLLRLSYPAGRLIDELAKKGNSSKYSFPIGLKNSKDANMSFSGLKTSLRLFVEKHQSLGDLSNEENGPFEHNQFFCDLVASYQEAIVQTIAIKLPWAQDLAGIKGPIVVGGGVACNSRLRQVLGQIFLGQTDQLHFVSPRFCTDNGAMIGTWALRAYPFHRVQFPQCLELDICENIL